MSTRTERSRRNREEAERFGAELRARENAERARRLREAPAILERHFGSVPTVESLCAALLEMSEGAYQSEVVDTDMVDHVEETREEWIESYLLSALESYVPAPPEPASEP
jgi:hypothetical protein